MKKLIILMGALLFSVSVMADPFYFGGSLGKSSLKDNSGCSSLDGIFNPGFSCNENDTDTGFKVFAGMNFTPTIAGEFGYVDLGKFTINANGNIRGIPVGINGDAKAHGWTVSGVLTLPIANQLSFLARLGLNDWKVEESASGSGGGVSASANQSATGTDPYFGLGLQYAMNKNLGLRGEWERYKNLGDTDTTGQSDVDLLSVGMIYKF